MSYKSEDDRRIERSIIAGHEAFMRLRGTDVSDVFWEEMDDFGLIYLIRSNIVTVSPVGVFALKDGTTIKLDRHACPDCGAEHEVKGGAMEAS